MDSDVAMGLSSSISRPPLPLAKALLAVSASSSSTLLFSSSISLRFRSAASSADFEVAFGAAFAGVVH